MNVFCLLLRIRDGLQSRFRNVWFRALGVRLNGYVWIRKVSIPRNWSDITIEGGAALDDGVVLLCGGPAKASKLVIREGVYVNRFTMFDATEQIEVGRNCMIGPHCYVTDHDHGCEVDHLVSEQSLVSRPVNIGEDVWIGAGVIILKGVTIGNGALIGAGAVVASNVPAGAKFVGVPAKQIGMRE